MKRSIRSRVVHALAVQRLLRWAMAIALSNLALQGASLICFAIRGVPLLSPGLASWSLLALLVVPLGLLAFRRWAVHRGWAMVYANHIHWLDPVAGQIHEEDDFPIRRMPIALQQRLASMIMSRGWISWGDVRECALQAGVPAPRLSLSVNHDGQGPATRTHLKTVVCEEAWSHARMTRYTPSSSHINTPAPRRL